MKKIVSLGLAILLLAIGLGVLFLEKPEKKAGELTVEDLLLSRSERTVTECTVLSSGQTPYHTMIGTPIACYYDTTPESTRTQHIGPLLVAESDTSRPVERFLEMYEPKNVIGLGDIGTDIEPNIQVGGANPRTVSELMAVKLWEHSDGVILVKANCQNAYNIAVATVPLASYVNIPVIVTHSLDSSLRATLEKLGVKYSIVCGNLDSYGKKALVLKGGENNLETELEIIQDLTREFIEHPDGLNNKVTYITMANPLDITEPKSDLKKC